MKIDEEALKVASAKLRKLRLTTEIAIKDTPPPAKTVKSVFQAGLDGLYDDDAITYALRFGVRYYLEAVEHRLAADECQSHAWQASHTGFKFCPDCGDPLSTHR